MQPLLKRLSLAVPVNLKCRWGGGGGGSRGGKWMYISIIFTLVADNRFQWYKEIIEKASLPKRFLLQKIGRRIYKPRSDLIWKELKIIHTLPHRYPVNGASPAWYSVRWWCGKGECRRLHIIIHKFNFNPVNPPWRQYTVDQVGARQPYTHTRQPYVTQVHDNHMCREFVVVTIAVMLSFLLIPHQQH